jgi:ketosteroid isomerase-like protein
VAVERTDNSNSFMAALERRDARAMAASYADNARLVDPLAGVIDGREQICAFWHAGLEAGIRDASFAAQAIAAQEESVFEVGRYTLRLVESEDGAFAPTVDTGVYVLVHRREPSGAWRFALHVLSPDQ